MHRPKMLLSIVALFGVMLVSMTDVAAASSCPSLAFTASAKPRAARKPGSAFAVVAKVRNTGRTRLDNVGLVINLPLNALNESKAHPSFKRSDASYTAPVINGQFVFWPKFSLAPGKGLTFKLHGKVDKCQEAGTYNVNAAVYIDSLDCATPLETPIEMVVAPLSTRRSKRSCPTQPPTTAPPAFEVYREMKPFGAKPATELTSRQLVDPLEDCYRQCYFEEELVVPFYYSVNGGVCYCAQETVLVYDPAWTTFKALVVPERGNPSVPTPAPSPATSGPTAAPTASLTSAPTGLPSSAPTGLPSSSPTSLPSPAPTTMSPTPTPTLAPTLPPVAPVVWYKPSNADWTDPQFYDIVTEDVWLTRQNAGPMYNYKYYLNNLGRDATYTELYNDYWYEAPASQGGTREVLWAILDKEGLTSEQQAYFPDALVGTMGDPANFFNFKATTGIVSVVVGELGVPVSFTGTFYEKPLTYGYWTLDNGGTSYLANPPDLIGKNLAMYIPETGLYCKVVFTHWGQGRSGGAGEAGYERSGCFSTPPVPTPAPTPIPGLCLGATPMVMGENTFVAINNGITLDATASNCAFEIFNANYWTFTPETDSDYVFSTCDQALWDTRIAIMNSCDPSDGFLTCNDDCTDTTYWTSTTPAVALQAGVTYYIAIGGFDANVVVASGILSIYTVTPAPTPIPPPGQFCGNGLAINGFDVNDGAVYDLAQCQAACASYPYYSFYPPEGNCWCSNIYDTCCDQVWRSYSNPGTPCP